MSRGIVHDELRSAMTIIEKALAILADKTLVHERVEPEEKTRRLAICEPCRFFDGESRKCKVCKCFMDVKTGAKTNFNPDQLRNEITHCPKGFWGDVDTANIYREKDGLSPLTTQIQN